MFDRSTNATFVPGEPGRLGRLALWPVDDSVGRTHHDGDVELVPLVVPAPDGLRTTPTPARLLPVSQVLDELVQLAPDAQVSRSIAAWGHVARVAVDLAARGRLQPAIVGGADTWVLAPLTEDDRQIRAALAAWLPPECHCLVLPDAPEASDAVLAPTVAVAAFYGAVADCLPRTAAAGIASGLRAWAGEAVADVADLDRFLPGPMPASARSSGSASPCRPSRTSRSASTSSCGRPSTRPS